VKVPYPLDEKYNATLVVGVCDTLNAVRVVDGKGKLAKVRPVIMDLIEEVWSGKKDAIIYGRHKFKGLPKLQGNQNDSLVDLPLVIQQELTNISQLVTDYIATWKIYKVCPLVLFSFGLCFFYVGCVLLVGSIRES